MCQIVNWKTCLKFPDEPKISAEAKDLICRLLCDVDSRLGTRGIEEIKVTTLIVRPFFMTIPSNTRVKHISHFVFLVSSYLF